jgi:hypothetical protein
MTHAKSLRVIGQKLELTGIFLFQLEHDGQNYTVEKDLPSGMADWVMCYAQPLVFSNADLTRLNRLQAKERRGLSTTSHSELGTNLPHVLRALGDHLDRCSARSFRIVWTPEWIIVNYKRADGVTNRLRYTPATLSQTVADCTRLALRWKSNDITSDVQRTPPFSRSNSTYLGNLATSLTLSLLLRMF